MPRFINYKGMAPGKLIMEFNDKLHIHGRVYRTSDLSELVGHPAMPAHNYNQAGGGTISWSLRLKRGYQGFTRMNGLNGATPHSQLLDFDAALCGNWAGVTPAGFFLDSTKFRQMTGGYAGNLVIDADTETGQVINSEYVFVYATAGQNELGVFLPAGPGGALAMYRIGNANGGASSIEAYPAGSTTNYATASLVGSRGPITTAIQFHYRVNDDPLRWYFLGINATNGQTATQIAVHGVLKSTLVLTTINGALAIPAGATAIGASGLGYANSAPSYAYTSDVNELSSYVLWRTTTNMEIHRVAIGSVNGTPTVTNNLVVLDQNPMALQGTTTVPSSARIVMVSHTDGNKYLVVFGLETFGAIPNGATATMYVYKLTDKNTAQYVGTYQLAPGPRSFLGSDDSNMRFVMVYDDRYEFWSMGAAGVLSKVDSVYVQRANANQYYEAEPYGFDSTGRFWYITPDSAKPSIYCELGLNFYSPPGQVNTIGVTFDSNNYNFSGAPVNGNLSVSVKDINGAYIAATVNLSPSANLTLSSSTVNTTTAGPTLVPFTITGPGDLSVDAWT